MARNIGILITAPVRPFDSEDIYATALSNEVQGGHHSYETVAERNAIPVLRRQIGMKVTVTNDGANNGTYELLSALDNTGWVIEKTVKSNIPRQLEVVNELPFDSGSYPDGTIFIVKV